MTCEGCSGAVTRILNKMGGEADRHVCHESAGKPSSSVLFIQSPLIAAVSLYWSGETPV